MIKCIHNDLVNNSSSLPLYFLVLSHNRMYDVAILDAVAAEKQVIAQNGPVGIVDELPSRGKPVSIISSTR